jgi:hypothetical protein
VYADDKPWLTEPNDVLFMTDAGYPAQIRRNVITLTLCGYIYLPADHPLHGVWYDTLDYDVDVHGGWTYSDSEGESWCVGFDCNHFYDYAPGMRERVGRDSAYRTIEFVTKELERTAKQFKAMESNLRVTAQQKEKQS